VLRSFHVVQVLDHGVDRGVPFIAMELLEGESLAARLERLTRLSPADAAWIFTHIARALSRVHEAGIVHRDLKPGNIFLIRNDEEEVAKVLDFGIAKTSGASLLDSTGGAATRTGVVLGTPHYMSPEQVAGGQGVDYRSDIWSMGVMGFECLVGRRPFEAESLGGIVLAICTRELPVPSHVEEVPPGFDEWFALACARDPTARFASAKEAAAELRRICKEAPPMRRPVLHRKFGAENEPRTREVPASPAKDFDALVSLFNSTSAPITAPREAERMPRGRRWSRRAWFAGGALAAGVLAVFAWLRWSSSQQKTAVVEVTEASIHAPIEASPAPSSTQPTVAATASAVALTFERPAASASAASGASGAAVNRPPANAKRDRPAAPVPQGAKPPPPAPSSKKIDLGI
jgi:serine/threonine-protein kinase